MVKYSSESFISVECVHNRGVSAIRGSGLEGFHCIILCMYFCTYIHMYVCMNAPEVN